MFMCLGYFALVFSKNLNAFVKFMVTFRSQVLSCYTFLFL